MRLFKCRFSDAFMPPLTRPRKRHAKRVTQALCMTTCLALAPAGWAQSDNAVKRLGEHAKFSELKSQMGREPDRSDPGGACGGIVVHDWSTENIRVITLGESVQAVTVLDAERKPSK